MAELEERLPSPDLVRDKNSSLLLLTQPANCLYSTVWYEMVWIATVFICPPLAEVAPKQPDYPLGEALPLASAWSGVKGATNWTEERFNLLPHHKSGKSSRQTPTPPSWKCATLTPRLGTLRGG